MNTNDIHYLLDLLKQNQYGIIDESSQIQLTKDISSAGYLKTGVFNTPFNSKVQSKQVDSKTTWNMQLTNLFQPESLFIPGQLTAALKQTHDVDLIKKFQAISDSKLISNLDSNLILVGKFTEQTVNKNSIRKMEKLLLIPSFQNDSELLSQVQDHWTSYTQTDTTNPLFSIFGDRFFKNKKISEKQYFE